MRVNLIYGDCFAEMRKLIKKEVKVDLVIVDPPYGKTRNSWDQVIDLKIMWELLEKLKKNENTPVIIFGVQPFITDLICSNREEFKYMKYWQKDRPSGFLNCNKQPLRDIEEICIFYKKQPTYNPVMFLGKKNNNVVHAIGKLKKKSNYDEFKQFEAKNTQEKFPRQLLVYSKEHPPVHPTQKPVELLADLIKTYSSPGDTILDFTMGSGSTGVACLKTNRNFIGIEISNEYFNIAKKRILEGK